MIATLPLDKMTMDDKISTMEILWENMRETPLDFISPSWHKELLKSREKAIKANEDKFIDWKEAKKDIWNSIS